MNRKERTVCPGCKRGCSAENVRCKFGRAYFAGDNSKEKKKKWERMVASDGLAWRFLMLAKEVKRNLRENRITEEQVFSGLTPEEQAVLRGMLGKIEKNCFKKHTGWVYMNQQ